MTDLTPIRLPVYRHLQDYNGYCGPACALMLLETAQEHGDYAQGELFRAIRGHASGVGDKRAVKSPAESLLSLINGGSSRLSYEKAFAPLPQTIAARLLHAIEVLGRPCILMINKGMHWVVAFGRTKKDDGSAGGVLLRDPAWAGMPKFFGLTIFPDKPAIPHQQSQAQRPCACLELDPQPGTVHERFLTMEELVSTCGLQGSPDWEGKGALALLPTQE
jgi:hypothetical protein